MADDVAAAANRNKPCPLSFAPGTLVATPDGYVGIETLKDGDLVMSKNEVTGEVAPREVLATISTLHEHDVRLITLEEEAGASKAIITSDEHPFYVQGKGWVEAGRLKVGDKVSSLTGKILAVVGSQRQQNGLLMYNLTVDEFHTYSVTDEQVWVHNCGDGVTKVEVSRSKYPEGAQHIEDAQAAGQPSRLTVNRPGTASNRSAAQAGQERTPGMDLDEYPPAMFSEGGAGASVRPMTPSQNRGMGACIGNQCRSVPDGGQVDIIVVD